MKNYQTFNSNSKDSKEPSLQALQSPDNSYVTFSENDLANSITNERERSSSISSLEQVIIHDPGYNGSLFSSVLTICNTIFGAGMLTIPYAIATIGLGNGIIAIIFFGFMSFFTLNLLNECAKVLGGRNVSFFSISSRTYPRLSIIFDLAIGIKCFGVSTSYLVIVGELLPKVTLGFFPNVSKDSVFLTRLFWITLCMLIVIPLSFQKSLSSLKYASTISLFAVNYIAVLVAYFFFNGNKPVKTIDDGSIPSSSFVIFNTTDNVSLPSNHSIEYFKWSIDFFKVLPIFVFAYTCHQNLFTVFNEMKITSRHSDNRHIKTRIVTLISISIAICIYLIIGITGYLTFGSSTKSNIISMYPPSNKLVLGGQTLMALMVCINYALQCHPARKSFGNVINYIRTMKKRSGYEPLNDGEETPILANNEANYNSEIQDYSKDKSALFKTKSQPSLTTPLYIKKNQQDSYNFASSSLTSNASTSSSVIPQPPKETKIGISKSYNDLYYILRNSKELHYHSIDMPPTNNVNTHSIQSQSFELSNTLHNFITSILLTLSYTIACSVNDLGTVLSVVGATGSTTICFILPGLLYYKIKKNERGDQKSTFLMKIAIVVSITGVILMMNSLFFIFVKI